MTTHRSGDEGDEDPRASSPRGKGVGQVDTGLPFLDHMLVTFARYAGLDLTLQARATCGTTSSRTWRSPSARRCRR